MNFKNEPLFHCVLREIRSWPKEYANGVVCVAVSGGVDSMVCLQLVREVGRVLGFETWALHIHHGWSPLKAIVEFRDQAVDLVERRCHLDHILFRTNSPRVASQWADKGLLERPPLSGEAALRAYRLEQLRHLKTDVSDAVLVFGHHRDDLVETQILRLIRGTSHYGLQGMHRFQNGVARPLLGVSRESIEALARRMSIPFLDDPANRRGEDLRSWIRAHWLPALEKRAPGALKSLAKSLDTLSRHCESDFALPDLDLWWQLSESAKLSDLAVFLRQQGFTLFTGGQLKEIVKNLSSRNSPLGWGNGDVWVGAGLRVLVRHGLLEVI